MRCDRTSRETRTSRSAVCTPRRSVIDRAIVAVRINGKQSEQSWEAFDLYGRRGVPIDETSKRLGMTAEAIRQAKSRISRQIRGEIERIRSEEG